MSTDTLSARASANLSTERRALLQTFMGNLRTSSGNARLQVSSTGRTGEDQARAMYYNYQRNPTYQRQLYGAQGDRVFDLYDSMRGQSATAQIAAGAKLIDRISAESPNNPVSHHLNSYQAANGLMTFDIGYSSITDRRALERSLAQMGITKVINEPANNCLHIELTETQMRALNQQASNALSPNAQNALNTFNGNSNTSNTGNTPAGHEPVPAARPAPAMRP
jgi:hypothetical protein